MQLRLHHNDIHGYIYHRGYISRPGPNIFLILTRIMKLFAAFLLHYVAADVCLICDYVGFAKTEDNAIEMLSGTGTNAAKAPICATVTAADFSTYGGNGQFAKKQYSTVSDKGYCIAQFFIYYAKDIEKYDR